jgi:hypothetical protein
MGAKRDDPGDVDRTLRLMKELAAVRERLADTQRRGTRPRVSRPESMVKDDERAARTSSPPASLRPPTK